MAVTRIVETSRLILRVQSGLNAAGQEVYTNLSLNGLCPDALDADVYEVGAALGALQQSPVAAVMRRDEGRLTSA